MTRHPTARRVHRQDTGTDDAFVANVLETSHWARTHARSIAIAAVVLAVVVVGSLIFVSSRNSRFEQATAALTPLRALAQSGQTEQAIPQLEAYLQAHGGTRPASEARLLLAGQYLATGQSKKAVDVVEPIGTDFDDPVAVNAAIARAAGYEALQEPHRAEEIYLNLGAKAPFQFQKNDALDNVARLRLARNDAAGAAEIYQRLLDMSKQGDAIRQIWEMRLAEARALAAGGGAAAAAAPAAR